VEFETLKYNVARLATRVFEELVGSHDDKGARARELAMLTRVEDHTRPRPIPKPQEFDPQPPADRASHTITIQIN
jgi:hypothetical protein